MLEIENLQKSYDAHVALHNVSLSIRANSIVGLIGQNGAGKTTLIRIINQIIKQDSGAVYIEGNPITFNDVRKIGYIPEERGLYSKMTVFDQLMFFASIKGVKRNDAKVNINAWLKKLELEAFSNQPVSSLSKGMKQKVQFIGCLLHRPTLLILDEPFSGFDPIVAEAITKEILKLKENGTTVMLSTHRMENVEELCSHMVVLHKSNKLLSGKIDELKKAYKENLYQISYKGPLLSHDFLAHFQVKEQNLKLNEVEYVLQLKNDNELELLQRQIIENGGTISTIIEKIPTIKQIYFNKIQNLS